MKRYRVKPELEDGDCGIKGVPTGRNKDVHTGISLVG